MTKKGLGAEPAPVNPIMIKSMISITMKTSVISREAGG